MLDIIKSYVLHTLYFTIYVNDIINIFNQTYVKHMLNICWTYVSKLVSWTYVKHMFDIFDTHVNCNFSSAC